MTDHDFSFNLEEHRLNNKSMWSLIFKKGHRSQFDGLFVRSIPSPDSQTRIGFILKKKIFRRAHERNYTKRIIREYIRHNQHLWREPQHIVFELKEKIEDTQKLNNILSETLTHFNK